MLGPVILISSIPGHILAEGTKLAQNPNTLETQPIIHLLYPKDIDEIFL
jgi:hypothetical protein